MIRLALLSLILILSISVQTALIPHAHILIAIAVTMNILGHEKLGYITLIGGLYIELLLMHYEQGFLFVILPPIILKIVDLLTYHFSHSRSSSIRYIINILFVILFIELSLGTPLNFSIWIALLHALVFGALYYFIGWRLTKRNPYHLNFVIKDDWY